jgi:hypothetical protein
MAKAKTKEPHPLSGCLFVQLKAIGRIGPSGRAEMSIGFGGRSIARHNHGFADLVIPFIETLMPSLGWSDAKAAKADLRDLQKYLSDLEVNDIQPPG